MVWDITSGEKTQQNITEKYNFIDMKNIKGHVTQAHIIDISWHWIYNNIQTISGSQ